MGITFLSPMEARAFYDRFGRLQDLQRFYEERALDELTTQAHLATADTVVELGCGTGRFAGQLLHRQLARSRRYIAVDSSSTMTALANERLRPFRHIALVMCADLTAPLPLRDASADHVISTYVLDLFDDAVSQHVVAEARRVLRPGGRLALAGITHGTTTTSRFIMSGWGCLFRARPHWVGGCRPGTLLRLLPAGDWQTEFRHVVVSWGVASEIVVARRL